MKMRDILDLLEAAGYRPANGIVSTPQFRAWFAGSKVVDAEGRPLVLYHGTGADISAFRGMVWGSISPALANDYAAMRGDLGGNSNVVPVYMRIVQPFDADHGLRSTVTIRAFFASAIEQAQAGGHRVDDAAQDHIAALLARVCDGAREEESGPHYSRHDFWLDAASLFGRDGAAATAELFRVLGFDGVKMVEHGEVTFGAFGPDQVKSVFNGGAFDPASPQISEARGGTYE